MQQQEEKEENFITKGKVLAYGDVLGVTFGAFDDYLLWKEERERGLVLQYWRDQEDDPVEICWGNVDNVPICGAQVISNPVGNTFLLVLIPNGCITYLLMQDDNYQGLHWRPLGTQILPNFNAVTPFFRKMPDGRLEICTARGAKYWVNKDGIPHFAPHLHHPGEYTIDSSNHWEVVTLQDPANIQTALAMFKDKQEFAIIPPDTNPNHEIAFDCCFIIAAHEFVILYRDIHDRLLLFDVKSRSVKYTCSSFSLNHINVSAISRTGRYVLLAYGDWDYRFFDLKRRKGHKLDIDLPNAPVERADMGEFGRASFSYDEKLLWVPLGAGAGISTFHLAQDDAPEVDVEELFGDIKNASAQVDERALAHQLSNTNMTD